MHIGQSLAHYKITAAIGAGGMGEVYRATDTTLGRDVAIKVLPADVAADPERLARFRREARVLASLNHPNIGAIYGFEEVDGTAFLTLELVEGQDLAERLRGGAVPTREALEIAKQIAEALEAAHERGIIHRDLKPANVKVTPSGIAKVLDFGLAKAWAGERGSGVSSANPSLSPTLVRSQTAAGVILGTAAYMSPEQARGRVVDRRADVWAFGVVVFEMLAGRALFAGETTTDVMSAVVTSEPDMSALPRDTPPAVRRLLRRCLQKDPRLRLPDIGSARVELSEVLSGVADRDSVSDSGTASGPASGAVAATPARRIARLLVPVGVVGALVAAYVAGRQAAAPAAARQPLIRVSLQTPEGLRFAAFTFPVMSPDGHHVVITGETGGQQMLWIRHLNALAFQPLAGTEGAEQAFWSPDSRYLAFVANRQLRLVSLEGGVRTLCPLDSTFVAGGTWNDQGTIVLSTNSKGRNFPRGATLVTVPASGGPPRPLTTLDASRGESGHYNPQFLPDGRHFAFGVTSDNLDHAAVFVARLDAPHQRQKLLAERSVVRFTTRHALFVRSNTLLVQSFDETSRQVHGELNAIAEGVGFFSDAGLGLFTTSSGGMVAYRPIATTDTQLTWVSRAGTRLSDIGLPQPYGQVALSPDERRAAVELQDADGRYDIWIVELARGVPTRLTFDPADDRDPVWSPDGSEIVFGSNRHGPATLFRKSLAGRAESRLFETKESLYPESWTPDGSAIVYQSDGTTAEGRTGWMWRLDGKTSPTAILKPGFTIDELQVSPDGRLLAYISAESGRNEVYLEPLGGTGEKVRVSTNGGGQPKWRRDGLELFFVSAGKLHAVAVRGGVALQVGLPAPLFDLDMTSADFDDYVPAADGQRFLVKLRTGAQGSSAIHVVMNWATPGPR